jgi:hypothetical protein
MRLPNPVLRGVPGDVRILQTSQSAQLIDIEYSTPGPFLVICKCVAQATNVPAIADYISSIGMARAVMQVETVPGLPSLERAVLARSITIVASNPNGFPVMVTGIVVPLDVTVDSSVFGSGSLGTEVSVDPSFGGDNQSDVISFAQNIAAQSFGVTPRGATIWNDSNNGTLYLLMAPGNAAIAAAGFSVPIPPKSLFIVPDSWIGVPMSGIWDVAGGGIVNITRRF